MDESTYRLVDTIMKLIAGVSAICVGGFAVYRYADRKSRELQKSFRERQFELYLEMASVVSALASAEQSDEEDEAERRFWTLYYGPFALIQEESITKPLVEYAKALRTRKRRTTKRALSLEFAQACRSELEGKWMVKLPHLGSQYDVSAE